MKRSGFLARKTPLKARNGFKRRKTALSPKRSVATPKRSKLPGIKTVRNKCDALLTPIVKMLHPKCLLCTNDTQVAHHHVHKSSSNRLRYDLDNLVNLCHHCHVVLHNNESYWGGKVIEYLGMEWFQKLDKKKNEIVKADVHWYLQNLERLQKIKDEIA